MKSRAEKDQRGRQTSRQSSPSFFASPTFLRAQGVMQYGSGAYYTGSWLDGQRHGKGRMRFE